MRSNANASSMGATRWLTSATAILPASMPDLFLAVLEDDVVPAVLAGAPRLAVADVGAGEVLELERDVLGDVADPGAVAEPGDEAAAPAERAGVVLEAREHLDERVHEARDLVARELLEDAEVDDHADDRLARPVVGAAEDAGLDDPEGRLGAGGRRPRRCAAARRGRAVAAGFVAAARVPRGGLRGGGGSGRGAPSAARGAVAPSAGGGVVAASSGTGGDDRLRRSARRPCARPGLLAFARPSTRPSPCRSSGPSPPGSDSPGWNASVRGGQSPCEVRRRVLARRLRSTPTVVRPCEHPSLRRPTRLAPRAVRRPQPRSTSPGGATV